MPALEDCRRACFAATGTMTMCEKRTGMAAKEQERDDKENFSAVEHQAETRSWFSQADVDRGRA